jgi:hypothetical protein
MINMQFEPSRWENSLIAQSYRAGITNATAARIDLSNLFEWEIRMAVAATALGTPVKFTISFQDPNTFPSTPNFVVAIMDPTMLNYTGSSLLLSSQGTSFPTGQATVWIMSDTPDMDLTVWGSRRV